MPSRYGHLPLFSFIREEMRRREKSEEIEIEIKMTCGFLLFLFLKALTFIVVLS